MKVVQILTPEFSNISNVNNIELGPGEKMTIIQVLIGKIENDFQFFASLSDGAELDIKSVIVARNGSNFKYNYTVNQYGVNSVSNFRLISALSGKSHKETTMQINFARGAHGARGSEAESVVLSENAKNITLPIINCDEEDVVGSHSLSTGHIDPLQLQYLITRGFSEAQARSMITRARILDILNLINDDTKLQYVYEALNE